MALDLKNDNTLLYLLKGNLTKVYRTLEADTEAGKTGLATEKSVEEVRKDAKQLGELIREAAERAEADKAELIEAIDSVEGTTLLHIESSRGTVFKHSQISTRLTVVLFRGGERITDAATMRSVFGPGAYLQWWWQRMGDDRFWLISSDDSRLSDDGFTFTLSPSDVDTKVTFRCELVT